MKGEKKVSLIQDLALLLILETSSNLATDLLGYFLEAELSKTENIFVALLWRYDTNSWFVGYEPSVTFFMCIFEDYSTIVFHYFAAKITQRPWNYDQNC